MIVDFLISTSYPRKETHLFGAISCEFVRKWSFETDLIPSNPKKFAINFGGYGKKGAFSEDGDSYVDGDTFIYPGENKKIEGSDDKNYEALKTHRWGKNGKTWKYSYPFENRQSFDCTLFFVETSPFYSGPGKRVFDVQIMDKEIKNIDVFKGAGGSYRVLSRNVKNVIVKEAFTLKFSSKVGDSMISYLECESSIEDSNEGAELKDKSFVKKTQLVGVGKESKEISYVTDNGEKRRFKFEYDVRTSKNGAVVLENAASDVNKVQCFANGRVKIETSLNSDSEDLKGLYPIGSVLVISHEIFGVCDLGKVEQ